jgi:N-acetylglucosaminyl-diphospho-decaprenol L-rhamnosyltransferase
MKLSIIIVNWNTCELLAHCIRSIEVNVLPSLRSNLEVFVVDNASSDGSGAMIQQDFGWIRLLQNTKNVGFATANNQAIRESKGRYVLLLNPDTWVCSGGLDLLVDFMEKHPEVGAAGSRLLNADGSLQMSCYPAPTVAREFWRLLYLDKLYACSQYNMHSWSILEPKEVDLVQGASLMVRRQTLEQVGLLDEDYFMYTEEVDWCYRIRRAGWHIYWVPASTVIHYGGQSTQQVATNMFLQLYKSKVHYLRKHHGTVPATVYKVILYKVGLLRVLLAPLAALVQPSRRQQVRLLAHNYRRLLFALPGM